MQKIIQLCSITVESVELVTVANTLHVSIILETMQRRLDRKPDAMTIRRSTVEHVFGTLKHWIGPAHFLTRTLGRVSTEMSLQVLAYNLKRVINILGVAGTMKAMKMAGS